MMRSGRARVGIDVGGTFNDLVLSDGATGRLYYFKEPSVPSDPSLAVERGMLSLLREAGLGPEDIGSIIHGTTLGLNAIIQRRGAHMALVVSRGNRDVFEIARSRMPAAYDFAASRERPLVPRDLVFEIGARIRADGSIVSRPSETELDELARILADRKVQAVAVMLLNSYRHPALEREAAAGLRHRLPGVLVTESAAISPEKREYERALLAGLNAYIHPLMASYFDLLEQRLVGLGIRAPIHITANNGGTVSLATARERPIDTILSGPASGVVAAVRIAPKDRRDSLITLDMGGTSTDMAVVRSGQPEFTMQAKVGEFPLILPVVGVTAIGAGGGSIVWQDAQGVVKIGPASAGADPGPACYGRGATHPAITDCYLAAGILDPDNFLGGRMTLRPDAASAALGPLADGLGLEGGDRIAVAAEAALRIATAKMSVEITKILARRGLDPAEFTLVAYGGAGATHACLLAEEAGIASIVIPRAPGTFCALGAVVADVRRDYARSLDHLLDPERPDAAPFVAAAAELEGEGLAWIARQGDLDGPPRTVLSAEMRYAAQAYELAIEVPADFRPRLDGAALAELFHREHERLYAFASRSLAVRIDTVRISVIGSARPIDLAVELPAPVEPVRRRRVWHAGRWLDAPVFQRGHCQQDSPIAGPALVEQPDTTIWILPGWTAAADAAGNLILARRPA